MYNEKMINDEISKVEKRLGSMRAKKALNRLLRDFCFTTVLDVGCGPKKHASVFEKFNKMVITCDMNEKHKPTYLGNILSLDNEIGDNSVDCVWASHVLEHQPNAAEFLLKLKNKLAPGGVLAITVPPSKHQIVGGHVSIWNMGLLLNNLVKVGFDCSEAMGLAYDYDISILVRKQDIDWDEDLIEELGLEYSTVSGGVLTADGGDFFKLKKFFPKETPWVPHGVDESFNGNLMRLGW